MQEKDWLEEVLEDLDPQKKEEGWRKYWPLFLIIFGLLGMYVYSCFFGVNSWSVLSRLRKQRVALEQEGERLRRENVDLQKLVFEFKGLEPNLEEMQ